MTKRNVMITIHTLRHTVANSTAEDDGEIEELEQSAEEWERSGEPEEIEMLTEGRLVTSADRVELLYHESEESGMEGSVTTIGFARNEPTLVTMMRAGLVSTAMVFEAGRRHICIYHTPFAEFEICVRTISLENRLLTDGTMALDYLIELHGAQAERCRMTIGIKNDHLSREF